MRFPGRRQPALSRLHQFFPIVIPSRNPHLTYVLFTLDSEISEESDDELDEETLYDRISALKDIIPPSARRTVTSTVSSLTSITSSTLSFSGKALWVISTSAFLIGVPWALAYAEEEQYIQMEREQGMIKGANEVR